jgi:hypothetical protein
MAITPAFSISISADRSVTTITDDSTYTSPVRSAVRVFMSLQKMTVDNVGTAVTLTPDDDDPELTASWEWDTQVDGWHKFYYVAIPAYAGGTTYAIYDAVYDTSTDVVYRSIQNTNVGHALSDTAWWEEISDPASLAANVDESDESGNITSQVYQRVLTFNSQYAYAVKIGEDCACTTCDDHDIIPEYNIFSLLLNGAIKADQWSEFIKGEQISRKIQGRFIDC